MFPSFLFPAQLRTLPPVGSPKSGRESQLPAFTSHKAVSLSAHVQNGCICSHLPVRSFCHRCRCLHCRHEWAWSWVGEGGTWVALDEDLKECVLARSPPPCCGGPCLILPSFPPRLDWKRPGLLTTLAADLLRLTGVTLLQPSAVQIEYGAGPGSARRSPGACASLHQGTSSPCPGPAS